MAQAFRRLVVASPSSRRRPSPDPRGRRRLRYTGARPPARRYRRRWTRVNKITAEWGKTFVHVRNQENRGSSGAMRSSRGVGRRPRSRGSTSSRRSGDDKRGVTVNDLRQTSNSNIFAAGDVAMTTSPPYGRCRGTYRHPERPSSAKRLSLAHRPLDDRHRPGDSARGDVRARRPGTRHCRGRSSQRTFRRDRPILDGEEEGFVKVQQPGREPTGPRATIVARHAGEMISEMTLADGSASAG